MIAPAPLNGAALVCDRAGMVVEVLRQQPDLIAEFAPPQLAASLWDTGSVPKWYELLRRLEEGEPVLGWELVARNLDGALIPVEVAASPLRRFEERVTLVVAVPLGERPTRLLDQLSRRSEELAEASRSLLARPGSDSPSWLLGEMPAVHNEMMALQRTLAKQNAVLERLHREKNQLLGMLAHDLRSPLNTIVLTATVLREGRDLPSKRRASLLGAISSSARYLADLVNDVLDLSVIESGEVQLRLQPTDLTGLVGEVVELHEMLAEKRRIRLEPRLPATPVMGNVDPSKIEQVLTNLISNAIKFSPAETTVTISLTVRDESAELRVEDQGQGIPDEQLSEIFRPFRVSGAQVAPGETSTGLGLAIVKRIVDRHHGTIDVQSTLGLGSVFSIRIPIRHSDPT